jgi:hypothetical protein
MLWISPDIKMLILAVCLDVLKCIFKEAITQLASVYFKIKHFITKACASQIIIYSYILLDDQSSANTRAHIHINMQTVRFLAYIHFFAKLFRAV